MTRHQRRKLAKQANVERSQAIALAAIAYNRALIVKRNMERRPERNYYPASCLANMEAQSHRAYICRA